MGLLCSLSGQNFTISGKTLAESGVSLGFVKVEISMGDSILTGAITDSTGAFNIDAAPGNYVLTAQTYGFEAYQQEINLSQDLDVGDIVLKMDENVTAVEITARKAFIKRELDRTIINLSGTILSDGDAWEALRLAPGIMVDQNGGIRMNGKNDIAVMIDGRTVQLSGEDLMDLISGISASEVATIEIISNPPANFSASGSGIVNITMKKYGNEGVRGNVRSKFKRGVYNKYTEGVSLTASKNKWYLNASYDLNAGKRNNKENTEILFQLPNENLSMWNEANESDTRYLKHGYHLYADYKPTKKSTISFRTDGTISPTNSTLLIGQTNITDLSEALDSSIVNENQSDRVSDFQSYFLGYENKGDKGYWRVNADYSGFSSDVSQEIVSDFFSNNGDQIREEDFQFDAISDVQILGAQSDWGRRLGTKSILDWGVKYSNIQTSNDLVHFNVENGNAQFNPERSNGFNYNEQNGAAFVSLRRGWDKLQMKAGLRAEYTDLNGSSADNDTTIDQNYLRVFPSLFLQYASNENSIWGLSLGTRINRPNYRYLNTIRMYTSPYSFVEGNPFLQPAMVYNLEVNWLYKQTFFFSAFASQISNAINEMSVQNNEDNTLKFLAINQDQNYQAGVSTNGSYDIFPWWSTYWDVRAFYQFNQFRSPDTGEQVQNNAFAFEPFVWTGFYPNRLRGLSFELQYSYYAPSLQGSFAVESRSELAFGMKKKFFDKRLAVALLVADLLDDNKFVLKSRFAEQDHVYRQDPENQYFRFNVTWKFGNQKIKNRKEQKSNTEEKERL